MAADRVGVVTANDVTAATGTSGRTTNAPRSLRSGLDLYASVTVNGDGGVGGLLTRHGVCSGRQRRPRSASGMSTTNASPPSPNAVTHPVAFISQGYSGRLLPKSRCSRRRSLSGDKCGHFGNITCFFFRSFA